MPSTLSPLFSLYRRLVPREQLGHHLVPQLGPRDLGAGVFRVVRRHHEAEGGRGTRGRALGAAQSGRLLGRNGGSFAVNQRVDASQHAVARVQGAAEGGAGQGDGLEVKGERGKGERGMEVEREALNLLPERRRRE